MNETYKTYKHNPPHLFRSNAKYFITGATYKKVHYMKSDPAKMRLLESIFKGFDQYGWDIEDWVILDNHYHLMVNAPENAETLSKIIQDIHKFTALWIKKNVNYMELIDMELIDMECIDRVDANKGNKKRTNTVGALHIFHNYWDTCITYEKSYFARLHYIWYNPVKHGYVADPLDWKFGSYFYRYRNEKNKIEQIIDKYPCDNVNVKDDF